MSLRDKILNADDLTKEEMVIEAWDVTINVCSMTGKQRSKLLQRAKDRGDEGLEDFYSEILAMTVRDPKTNELIFSEKDYDALMGKNIKILEEIVNKSLELNGLGNKSIEEAEKN